MLIFIEPNALIAGAWNLPKNLMAVTTSANYSSPIKYRSYSHSDKPADLDTRVFYHYNKAKIDNKILTQISSINYEYGYSKGLTLLANSEMRSFIDLIEIDIKAVRNYGSLKTRRYLYDKAIKYSDTTFSVGFKQNIYTQGNSVVSYQMLLNPGPSFLDERLHFVGKNVFLKSSLLYGRSFNIPFGLPSRPQYSNYLDIDFGHKIYPGYPHNEFHFNAQVGIRPFNDRTLLIAGLFNTINFLNYQNRPFNLNELHGSVNVPGLKHSNKLYLKDAISSTIRNKSSNSNHSLALQIAYNPFKNDPNNTMYGKYFLNIKSIGHSHENKALNRHSFYLSYEHKF